METIAKKEAFEKTFGPPEGMIGILVEGNCLEPAIRDGQMVFATRHMGNAIDIAKGTPVVVHTDTGSIIKLWNGVRGNEIVLRYLNDKDGRSGYISVRNDEILGIWIVRGIWFGDTPFIAERSPDMPGVFTTRMHVLRTGELPSQHMERYQAAVATSVEHTLPAPKPSPASKEKTTGKKPSGKEKKIKASV